MKKNVHILLSEYRLCPITTMLFVDHVYAVLWLQESLRSYGIMHLLVRLCQTQQRHSAATAKNSSLAKLMTLFECYVVQGVGWG